MVRQVDLYKAQAVYNDPQTVNQINSSTVFIDEEEEGDRWKSTTKLKKGLAKFKNAGSGAVNTTGTSDDY